MFESKVNQLFYLELRKASVALVPHLQQDLVWLLFPDPLPLSLLQTLEVLGCLRDLGLDLLQEVAVDEAFIEAADDAAACVLAAGGVKRPDEFL